MQNSDCSLPVGISTCCD